MERRIGLIVNPIAGMGGAVGLKGTDGDRASRARALGASPLAAGRCRKALSAMPARADDVDWLTAAGAMGADSLEAAGFRYRTVYRPDTADTSADDTRRAAKAMLDAGADLILFTGGDGTAIDVFAAVDGQVPILGIPAGVKMHSAVFAVSPRAAGEAVRAIVEAGEIAGLLEDAEIMDRPEDDAAPELLGYARTPALPRLVAHGKAAAPLGSVEGACRHALERIRDARGLVLIGPGMTMRRLKQALGFDGTLLGVDAVADGKPVGIDLSAPAILELMDAYPAGAADSTPRDTHGQARPLLVMSVVGGQGFLFGRGNQQLSAEVLRRIDRDRVLIVSSMEKLVALPERRLFVDTGDDEVDASFAGFLPVVVGERQSVQVAVGDPEAGSGTGSRRSPAGPLSAAVNGG